MSTRIEDELISVKEAAKMCGRNMETVRRWIWSGKLPAEKLGNQLFIKRNDFASFCRLPARSVPAKAGEIAVREYKAETVTKLELGSRTDLIRRMRKLRERIRASVGNLDAAETIEQLRKERSNELTRLR